MINYLEIKREIALRLAQLRGTSQSTLEASYTGSFGTALDGAEIPLSAIKDLILTTERELVQLVGNNAQHPARSQLYGRSVNLADLASTPTVSNSGAEFFGVFDSCADASNNRPCTWQPTQTIADIVDGAPTFFGTDYYYYNINGNFIRTTRTAVFLQGVAWNYEAQAALYDSDDDSPLPAGLAPVWIDGVSARAAQVSWIDNGVLSYYANLYEKGKADFNALAGMPNVPLASQEKIAG